MVARGGYCLLEYPTTSYIVAGRSRPLAGMYISPDSGHYSIMTTKAGGDHLLDGVPLIGKVYPWSKHLYTATAFQKWGLSTSMVAASILRDHILGEANLWASAFKSLRFRPIYSFPTADVKYLKE